MRHIKRNLICMAVMATMALMGSGCFDDEPPTDPIFPGPSYPFPDTAQKLMVNYKKAYDEMNIDEYRNTLHSDFTFVFVGSSPVAPTTGTYTREEDLQSTTRMFNGELGHDLLDQVKPGVRDVEFHLLEQLTDWEDVPETDPHFAGCIRAMYDVRVVFYLITDDLNTIAVDSQQMFYLQPQDEMQQDGSTTQHFYLIGQQDLESVHAGNEDMSWGGVKALYY